MVDTILIICFFVFGFAACAMFIYYKKVRGALREYTKAKNVLNDIMFSFNKDLQSLEEEIQEVKGGDKERFAEITKVIAELRAAISNVEKQIERLAQSGDNLAKNYDSLKAAVDSLTVRQNNLSEKTYQMRLSEEAEQPMMLSKPPIPIRRERALSPLTNTELKILELLAAGGEKTAPEIREEINLTREHTARLMKKLYARGYVERRTDRIPYVYRLKKEMEGFLKEQGE